ncbi:F-box/kelch-repeat protein At3g06240-like [Euphorbia lathyris]|uniref:F-box/kelch-repeat protein At3g06240-like n=1 Tax=Euphorbia lathyris TaxID=212925 RepID=UPI0033140E14
MPKLVEDCIVNVLLRLPVKSLCRFKSVCKSWCCLISDPHFIRMHLNLASTDSCLSCRRWKLCLTSFSLPSVYLIEHQGAEADHRVVAAKLDYPLKTHPFDEVKFIGSCNGLLCVASEPGVLLLINPCTREAEEIPRLGGNRRYFTELSLPYMFGFGYAQAINDYKLVNISCKGCVFVYSLKAKSWRSVGEFPYSIVAFDPGIQLNGAIHWAVSCSMDPMNSQTIAFDLVDEKFYDVPPPGCVKDFYSIAEFGGCLCIVPDSTITTHNDFWVMKRYGIKESWTKIVISLSYFRMKPLGIFENGRAVLEIDGKLVVYNINDGSYHDLVIHGIPVGIEFEVERCIESLVSPRLRLNQEQIPPAPQ